MSESQRPTHLWLKEAVLAFCNELPPRAAELRVREDTPPTVFEADIIPTAQGAAPIKVLAEEGDLEAMIAFGQECQADARYYPDEPTAEGNFKQEVLFICRAIAMNKWQERIVFRGDEVAKSEALFPPPVGRIRVVGVKPFSFRAFKKKTERTITWEPYFRVQQR